MQEETNTKEFQFSCVKNETWRLAKRRTDSATKREKMLDSGKIKRDP